MVDVMRVLQEVTSSPRDASALESQPLHTRKKIVSKFMRERLPERLQHLLEEFGRVGEELGYSVYAVGGFVRDLLMRVENFDIDIVVEGDGILFAEAVERKIPCRIRTHQKFGTAIILLPDGLKIDVATARVEIYDSPAALPTVETGSIKMDLYRRDFTINTLAIHLNPGSFGEMIDFFGGMRDIKEKVIRVLHNLSFVEDPTRIFRAIRFEQRLGFQIAKHAQNLMRNSVKMGFLQRLSGGRILAELFLILKEDNPTAALGRMKDFDLFPFLHPGLRFDGESIDLFERIHHVISWFDLLFREEAYERWLIYFYGLIDLLKPEEIEEMSHRLVMNEKERNRVVGGKWEADQTLLRFFSWINEGYEPKRSEIYGVLDPLPTETKLFMMAKTNQTTTRRYISLYFTQLKDVRTLLRGADLIRIGMQPGPFIKKTLANLLQARLDEQVKTQQDEMEFVWKQRTANR